MFWLRFESKIKVAACAGLGNRPASPVAWSLRVEPRGGEVRFAMDLRVTARTRASGATSRPGRVPDDGLDHQTVYLYNVHMKRVTASEARRNWFRILDEVAGGATVVVERHGQRIVIRREEPSVEELPDYGPLIRVPDADEADRWGWSWPGEEGDLEPEPVD